MRECVTLVDGDGVGYSVSAVKDDSRGSSGGVEGEDCLYGYVEGGDIEGFEHDLGHSFSVIFGVEGGLCEEAGVLLRSDPELVVEAVVPDFFHVVPVGDDSMFDGVAESENSSFGLGFFSDIGILLVHSDHYSGHFGSANNRGEGSSFFIIKKGIKWGGA